MSDRLSSEDVERQARVALGSRLRTLRKLAGWTMAQAADVACVTVATLRNWERGRVDAPYLAVERLLSAYAAQGGFSEPRPALTGSPTLQSAPGANSGAGTGNGER